MPYLLKSEPDHYSYDDLLRDGETVWDGIRNPQALITLRNMKSGEHCVIYHSNIGKEAVGTAAVVSVDASDPKNPAVRLRAGKRLKQPKSLAMLREAPVFHDSLLFRQFRLSVVPLNDAQYDWLLHGEASVPATPAKKSLVKQARSAAAKKSTSKPTATKPAPKKSPAKGKKA